MNYLQVGHVLPDGLHLLDALLHDVACAEDGRVVLHRLLHLEPGKQFNRHLGCKSGTTSETLTEALICRKTPIMID